MTDKDRVNLCTKKDDGMDLLEALHEASLWGRLPSSVRGYLLCWAVFGEDTLVPFIVNKS